MLEKKQEAKKLSAPRITTPQKDVQQRYQQDFSRYKQQIERSSKVANCPKAA